MFNLLVGVGWDHVLFDSEDLFFLNLRGSSFLRMFWFLLFSWRVEGRGDGFHGKDIGG